VSFYSAHLCLRIAASFAVIAPHSQRGALERGRPPLRPPVFFLRYDCISRMILERSDLVICGGLRL
jgi:hypothetical protein